MPATDKYVHDLKKVHVVFALSALGLFLVTIWMLYADHTDEWRKTQRTAFLINAERTREQLDVTKGSADYQTKLAELQQQKAVAKEEFDAKESERLVIEAEVKGAQRQSDLAERAVKARRAERDVARANYDLGIRDNVDEERLGQLKAFFDNEQRDVDQLELELQEKEAAQKELVDKLKTLTAARDETDDAIKGLNAEIDRMQASLDLIAPSGFNKLKRAVMEWPIVDGFNSHHEIQQDWLPDLPITLGMTETARFDRCRTCHLNIDQIEAGNRPAFPHGHPTTEEIGDWVAEKKYPHPFSTHPRPELYLTASSPHPVETFGCTICHEGQGAGTEFSNSAHYPNDPHQHHEWEKEYGFKTNHFWEYPMYPERLREAACIKCHHSVTELGVHPKFGPTAPKVFQGYELVKKYGCFGCHEIHGFTAGKSIGPDLRLEPRTEEEKQKIDADPSLVAGNMRKVGPALRHIKAKTTPAWTAYWTEEPKRFRPTTKMPEFFHLTNQQDPHAQQFTPVELAAVARYLFDKSETLDLLQPEAGYQPNAGRGKELFATNGCLACHSRKDFPETTANVGPELSSIHQKIRPGREGFSWLYTWIRDPERHHARTLMPNFFLEAYTEVDSESKAKIKIDPAADIAAYLLTAGENDPQHSFDHALDPQFSATALNELAELYLSKAVTKAQVKKTFDDRKYPIPPELITGDEIELASTDNGAVSDEEWHRRKLNYVGRRTISRYGCYACHDIPGFEAARPIGTTLQDWGRKDTTKLALEHIEEFLHHHGEADGSSTRERAEKAVKVAESGDFRSDKQEESELRAGFFYEDLLHHGRAGFLWQKLRAPRSYDYMKTETKGYDERLRMPKFPLSEDEMEAIATFVLGLVAEPPPAEYLYQPTGADFARIEGERLLRKYNCVGCHIVELPEIRFGANLEELNASVMTPADHPEALELLLQLKPPRDGKTGETIVAEIDEEKLKLDVISFRGLIYQRPEEDAPIEEREHYFDLWETLQIGEKLLFPGTRITVPEPALVTETPARGGRYAEWLVEHLMETRTSGNRFLARQKVPPPLYKEGIKVQTPWMYQFLRDPNRIRYEAVLRMPKFNISAEEAQSFANYFAAVDDTQFPYQQVPQRDPEYVSQRNEELKPMLDGDKADYLTQSWKTLNAPLCIKCHSLGGRSFQISDPKKDVRGPDLRHVADRLRPDWTLLWLYKPQWIAPYTSMPANFPNDKPQFPELFDGDAKLQTTAVRDALMNYHRLLEREGKTIYEPKPPTASADAGGE